MKTYNKNCYILILLILVLLGGCSSDTDMQIAPKILFPDMHGWDLKKITIADTDSNVLEFKRINCVWVVGDDNKPSDEPKVSDLAERLVSLTPQELPELKPDRYRDFRVGDDSFSRKIVLTFKDNSSSTLLVGSPALTKPAYIRFSGGDEVYGIDEPLLKQINLDSRTWQAD